MRVTLRAVNAELAKRGHHAILVNGDRYFYFRGGEATDWLDRTVRVPTLSSLTVDQWVKAFQGSEEEKRRDSAPTASGSGLEHKANKRRTS
jgi:hypothetical protein